MMVETSCGKWAHHWRAEGMSDSPCRLFERASLLPLGFRAPMFGAMTRTVPLVAAIVAPPMETHPGPLTSGQAGDVQMVADAVWAKGKRVNLTETESLEESLCFSRDPI